jgi:hypothetical protein
VRTYQHARLDLHRCSLDAILLHFACFTLISNNAAVRIEKKEIRGHSYAQKLASDVFDLNRGIDESSSPLTWSFFPE